MNAETILQNQIRIALSDHGICIRLNSGVFMTDDCRPVRCGLPGLPDLVYIGPNGKTVWLEVKTADGAVRSNQKRFIARLTEMGHTAGIVRSVDDAMELIGVIWNAD